MKNDKCSVVFVDPDLKYLSFALKTLKREGIHALGVSSLKRIEQIQTLDAAGKQLVFIDLEYTENVPDRIRKLTKLPGKYIIVLFPVELNPHAMSRVFRLGAYDCVEKFFDREHLLKQVKEFIQEACLNFGDGETNKLISNHNHAQPAY